jgi:uncharacterized membrane protein YebE (DUF533 family)
MFKIFESEEKKAVKSHLRQMVRLAYADGNFHEKEKKFILKVAKENDISRSDVDEIIENPTSVELFIPESKDEKFEQIFDLVRLMSKDGEVTDPELEFCQELATRLGFRKVIVGVLVEKIERGLEAGHSRKKIKKDCASFINY